MSSRLESLRTLVAKSPNNAAARFGLANEAMKEGLYEEAVEQLQLYLAMHDDEGNAYGRLAEALLQLGRVEEATSTLRRGIDASNRHGHPGMANEFELRLEELEA
jgi:tetratricopeptide (TPR) repeat protein